MNFRCRICGTPGKPFMSFGRMPIANGFLSAAEIPDEYFFELAPSFCDTCTMFQLTVWRTAYDQKRPYLDLDDAVRAVAHVIDRDLFDGRVYNVLTLNATVREIVEALRDFVPDLETSFVDSPIMNQLSYEVSSERFRAQGFTATGDIKRGIGATIAQLRAAYR